MDKLMNAWIGYVIVINAISLFLMKLDQFYAVHRRWRISERTLLWVAFIGGAVGTWIAMYVFRHKVRKPKFVWLVPLFMCLHGIGLWAGVIYFNQ